MTAHADDDGTGVVPSNLVLLTGTYYNFFSFRHSYVNDSI